MTATCSGHDFDACRAEGDAAGGDVVDVDQRTLARVNAALATLRTGLAEFGPGGALLFANPRFGELFGLAPPHPPAGARFSDPAGSDGDARGVRRTRWRPLHRRTARSRSLVSLRRAPDSRRRTGHRHRLRSTARWWMGPDGHRHQRAREGRGRCQRPGRADALHPGGNSARRLRLRRGSPGDDVQPGVRAGHDGRATEHRRSPGRRDPPAGRRGRVRARRHRTRSSPSRWPSMSPARRCASGGGRMARRWMCAPRRCPKAATSAW